MSITKQSEQTMNIEQLTSGATVLFTPAGNVSVEDGPQPTVLLLHGWGTNIFISKSYMEIATALSAGGINTLMLSLRGHGPSEGELGEVTRAQHMVDIIEACRYLRKRSDVDMKMLGALGSSYGGYMLAVASNQLPLKSLVLRAPALYPNYGWERPSIEVTDTHSTEVLSWRYERHNEKDCAAFQSLSEYKGKLQIFAGTDDTSIPKTVIDGYCQTAEGMAASVKRIDLQGAGHIFADDDKNRYVLESVLFFVNTLAVPSLATS